LLLLCLVHFAEGHYLVVHAVLVGRQGSQRRACRRQDLVLGLLQP
jgi:hypothetical protein